MKKAITILLSLLMMLSVAACGRGQSAPKPIAIATEVPATAEPTPKPTAEPTPIPTPEPYWSIDYYLDDYGDKTDEAYVMGKFDGTFSNTATTNSDLTVLFFYSPNECSIRLLEYDSIKANFPTGKYAFIQFKIDNDEYKIDMNVPNLGEDLYLYALPKGMFISAHELEKQQKKRDKCDVLVNALKEGKQIKCVIKNDYASTYYFTLEGEGFNDKLITAFEKKQKYSFETMCE